MKEFLEKLKRKPEHVRKRIAIFSTLGISFLILNIWWVSWTSPLNEDSIAVTEVASPLAVVANMVFGLKDDADHMVASLQNQMHYSATDTPPALDQTASVGQSSDSVVYPDQVFGDRHGNTTAASSTNN